MHACERNMQDIHLRWAVVDQFARKWMEIRFGKGYGNGAVQPKPPPAPVKKSKCTIELHQRDRQPQYSAMNVVSIKLGATLALVALLAVLLFVADIGQHDQGSSLQNPTFSARRLDSLRSVPPRKVGESAIPPLGQSPSASEHQIAPQTKPPPKTFSLASWFGSSTDKSTRGPSRQQLPVSTTPVTVTQGANFVLSPEAQKEQAKRQNKQPGNPQASTSTAVAKIPEVKLYGKLTKPQCAAKYGERRYLPIELKKFPPMLYTFPGSGNTWCRLLIEYATGIYSGSVYNDQSLLHSLPGEFTCNSQVSVVKIHPHTHPFEGLRTGHFNSDANKCKRGGIDKIRRAVLLIRDPFDSIWSEFQRRITQSHVGGVLKANFNWPRWQANAAALSHQYHLMWAVHHAGIEKHFAPKDILYLKYEDLKEKSTRVKTLQKVAKFLDISAPTEEQLECAFALADNRETHRIVDKSLTMSKEEAYTVPLACRMWALFGEHAAKHGYKMWRDIDCSRVVEGTHAGAIAAGEGGALADVPGGSVRPGNAYPPIPRVNVGGQGEYDRKWVKPGQALLDFGGHPTAQPAAIPAGNTNPGPRGSNKKVIPGRNNGPRAAGGGGGRNPHRPTRVELTRTAPPPPQTRVENNAGAGQVGASSGAVAGAIYQVPNSDAAPGFSASDIARAIASKTMAGGAAGDTTAGSAALRGGGDASAAPTPDAQALLLQQLAKPIPKNPLQKRQRGGRKGQQMLQNNGALTAPKLRDLPMTGNSVDIGGRDKADLSAWLTDTAHKAEKGLSGAEGAGVLPPMSAADSLGNDGGSASALMQRKDKARARKGAGGKMRREGGGNGSGGGGGGKGGMTMAQASQKDAVLATVGADKPAWQ